MKNTVLLIVDIQNDFLKGGALEVKNSNNIVQTVNKLQKYFDLIVATQDWHPNNHKSFAKQHKDNKIGDFIDINGIDQILWPDHCIENSFGAELSAELTKDNIDKIFRKGSNPEIDSYSGFFENDKISKTGLDEYLIGKNVDTIYVCGLATDYCVKFTALDSLALGYETYLIQDACKGVNINPKDTEIALSDMKSKGIKIVNSSSIIF